MKTKKLISLFLVMAMLLTFSTGAFASENNEDSEVVSLEKVIQNIENTYPGAEIQLDENNALQVFIPDMDNKTVLTRSSTTETECPLNAPEGGTYRSFKTPWYISGMSGVQRPYSIVYLPHEQSDALLEILANRTLLDAILTSYGAGWGIDAIICMISQQFGIVFTYVQVVFTVMSLGYNIYDYVNRSSFIKARQQGSGAVRIAYTTIDGWPVNMYNAWSGSTVNCSPFEEWNPTFYYGEINF